MNNPSFNFLAKISRYLWRLVIIDNSFKAGSYLLVVSVILLLAARVFGISFLATSYLLLISPLIGLTGGAIIGLINKPALADVALVIDRKSGSNNYFSTAYECSGKPHPNPVENALVNDMAGRGGRLTEVFVFSYNWRNLYLFVTLSGIFLVIWFTPVAPSMPVDKTHTTGLSLSNEDNIITISRGLSEVKGKTQDNYLVQEFIRDIEALLENIRNNPRDKTVLLERVDNFLRDLPGLEIPDLESARLRALLEKLASLGSEISAGGNAAAEVTLGGVSIGGAFSSYQPGHSKAADIGILDQGRPDKSGQARPDMVLKTKEEAINNPYLPGEYKEIVKKYFMDGVGSKQ